MLLGTKEAHAGGKALKEAVAMEQGKGCFPPNTSG